MGQARWREAGARAEEAATQLPEVLASRRVLLAKVRSTAAVPCGESLLQL